MSLCRTTYMWLLVTLPKCYCASQLRSPAHRFGSAGGRIRARVSCASGRVHCLGITDITWYMTLGYPSRCSMLSSPGLEQPSVARHFRSLVSLSLKQDGGYRGLLMVASVDTRKRLSLPKNDAKIPISPSPCHDDHTVGGITVCSVEFKMPLKLNRLSHVSSRLSDRAVSHRKERQPPRSIGRCTDPEEYVLDC